MMLPPCGTSVLCRREKMLGTVGSVRPHLADVADVIEADAEDLVRVRDHRQQLDLIETEIGCRIPGRCCDVRKTLGCNGVAQARGQRAEIDDATVDEHPEFRCVRMAKTNQPHEERNTS